ncbi:enoyl-CoA hydratase [Fredinandcohnia sp. QZ13]|uniref:enoyl-CoA hydratase n=1 Tax=Fredinandcohnia sp. QZ13 TaxID=3073144 RepID=UPI002852F731|nr:enoyl-CoA hydratase [Fredinandcohnia sp. QZ13]MDR4887218.1 enoyl-CoA hydratase [Fredinandcohnia sp. QZ13]
MTTEQVEKVFLHMEERVAYLTLNRPDSLNSMDFDMLNEILHSLKAVAANDEVDILVLAGSGRAFSAGGDIKTMLSSTDDHAFEHVMGLISEIMKTLYLLPKLVISAIHGPAAGLGLSFALGADYVIADRLSSIAMNFIRIGLIPDGGAHFFLEKRLGEAKAKHVIWEGKQLSPGEALHIGLIDEVAEEELQTAVLHKLKKWKKRPILAMIQTKSIYNQMHLQELERILELEKQGQQAMRNTKDHREGIQAFLEKRKPMFTGE